MDAVEIDTSAVRDISPEALDPFGRLRVLPAAYWATTNRLERALFGHRHGVYSFPTTELVHHLADLIAGRNAIEIGAGHGVLADALGIVATDNKMQIKDPYHRTIYHPDRVPPAPYGANVEDCDAAAAVRKYRPDVVIACWVTHRYDPARHEAGGNEIGVDEEDILRHCGLYVVVGNTRVHQHKSIWSRPHTISHPTFVYSRASNGTPDFIAAWQGTRY